jgi:hypothetical protein
MVAAQSTTSLLERNTAGEARTDIVSADSPSG